MTDADRPGAADDELARLRAQVADQHVRLGQQLVQHGDAGLGLQVEGERLLAPADPDEMRGQAPHDVVSQPTFVPVSPRVMWPRTRGTVITVPEG